MARKFFNKKVHSTQKTMTQIIIICACVIGIIICFVLANYFNSKKPKDAVIEMRDSVYIEINTELPDKTIFFTTLENVSEDDIKISYADVDIAKIGEYPVTIKIYNEKYSVKVHVVDTIAPMLTLEEIHIDENQEYQAKDFVTSCTDNSTENCQISFYDLAVDQDGNSIDYSKYKENGKYKIQIVGSDSSENSVVKDTFLIIGTGEETPSNTCKYGSNEYDKDKYIMAVDISENGCAIDANLYKDEQQYAAINRVMDEETERLKKEFKKLKGEGTIQLFRNPSVILNKEETGIVGYTLHIKMEITQNGTTEVVEEYDLTQDGKRIFTINKYNLE